MSTITATQFRNPAHAEELGADPFIVDGIFMGAARAPVQETINSVPALTFVYSRYDSDEGEVRITYTNVDETEVEEWSSDDSFDVAVSTGSDTWDLSKTASSIAAAVALHQHLGRDKPYGPFAQR